MNCQKYSKMRSIPQVSSLHMSDDLNSLYDPKSREFGKYVIVFQDFDLYVCYLLSFFGEYVIVFQGMFTFAKSHGTPSTTLFTSMNFDHTSYSSSVNQKDPEKVVQNPMASFGLLTL